MNTTIKVHQQLKQIAYNYLLELIKLNNTGDESQWRLTPGTYQATDIAERVMAKERAYKPNGGAKWIERGSKHISFYLQHPENCDDVITISEGSFSCSFKLKDIFVYLHGWEQLPEIKAKDKFSYEIAKEDGGELECIKTPVYYWDDKKCKYASKRKTLVRLAGCIYILKSDYAKWEHDLITFVVKVGDVYFIQSEKQHTKNTIQPLTKHSEEWLYNFIERNKHNEQYNQLFQLIGDSYKPTEKCEPGKIVPVELGNFIESVNTAILAIAELLPLLSVVDAFLDAYTRFVSVFNAMMQVNSKLAEIGDILESVELERDSIILVCADRDSVSEINTQPEPEMQPQLEPQLEPQEEPNISTNAIAYNTAASAQIRGVNTSRSPFVVSYGLTKLVNLPMCYVGCKVVSPPGLLPDIRGSTAMCKFQLANNLI